MSVELRRLRTFIAIAEHGGFTAAGQFLGLTQSAISNQMQALENDLRVELFDRSKRPPVLNAHGISILASAQAIMKAYSELSGDRPKKASLSGIIRISTTATPLISLIPRVLKKLGEEAPNLRAIITTGMSSDICRAVANGEVDCGLITDLGALPLGLACVPVKRDLLIAIVPSNSAASDFKEAISLHSFIRIKQYTSVSSLIEKEIASYNIEAPIRYELDSFEAIIQLVRQGLGCAVVSQDSLNALNFPEVKSISFGSHPVRRNIVLVERSNLVTSSHVTMFKDLINHVANEDVER